MSGTTPPLDQQLEKLSRGLKFRGMRFQLNMSAPFDLQANVDYQYTTHILCAWTVMNLDPITEAPLELPSFNLFTNSEYDKADILWREAFTLNFGGTSGNIPYQHTFRSREALRDPTFVIKTRRNLRENQALIFVLQTYNLFQDSLNLDFDLFGYAAVQNWT